MLDASVSEWWGKLKSFAAEDDDDLSRLLVWVVLAAIFFIYWYVGLRYFIFAGAAYGADNSSHLAEIIKVAAAMREGRFDAFWFSQVNLGYPLFQNYNVLPYLLMGALVAVTQTFWQPMHVYNTSVIFLHALVPLCWYVSARLMRLPRLISLCFALFSVFMREYTMFGPHAGTTMGMGLYTQLWALPLLPSVLACYYRFLVLATRDGMLATIVMHSLLCSIHNLFGFFAGIGGLWFFILCRKGWRRYLCSQVVIISLFSYWIVAWFGNSIYLIKIHLIDHPIYSDGFVLTVKYLVEGYLFDDERSFPLLTLLVGVGMLVTLRTQTVLRAWAVYFFLCGIAMWLYAPGDSLLARVIPFFQEIPYRRYATIIQVGGALLGAWGAGYLLSKAARVFSLVLNISATTIMRDLAVITAVLLSVQHLNLARQTFRSMFIDVDFVAAAKFLQREPHARFLVHDKFGTGSHFFRNLMPLLADRAQLTTYARGIRDSLSSYYTTRFDFAPLSAELFNVRYLISNGRQIPLYLRDGFALRQQFGRIRVYVVDRAYGYFDVVQSTFAVAAYTSETAVEYLRRYTRRFYRHGVLPRLVHEPPEDMPYVSFEGGESRYYLQAGGVAVEGKRFMAELLKKGMPRYPGQRIQEKVSDHVYRATLSLDTSAYLLLKVSYHHGWHATVNGESTTVYAVAPNLMAVSLPAGQHTVVFSYRADLLPRVLFLLCVLAWLVLLGWLLFMLRRGVGVRLGRDN